MQGGRGQVLTDPLHGLIQHLAIIPHSWDTVWSIRIIDQEEDVIYERRDLEGRMDDKEGLPVGKDMQQKIRIEFYDSTKNEQFKVLMKTREK